MNLKQSLIENNSILLNQSAANWEDAIKIGTDLLVKAGTIEPRYYDNIVSKIKEMGLILFLHRAWQCLTPVRKKV